MNFKALKILARSNRWQILYQRAKEIGTLKLFNNDSDLASDQIWMLFFLEMFSGLYLDLAMKEKNISEEVIKDDLRVEAYLLWKKEKKDKKSGEGSTDTITNKNLSGIPSVVFKRKPKK